MIYLLKSLRSITLFCSWAAKLLPDSFLPVIFLVSSVHLLPPYSPIKVIQWYILIAKRWEKGTTFLQQCYFSKISFYIFKLSFSSAIYIPKLHINSWLGIRGRALGELFAMDKALHFYIVKLALQKVVIFRVNGLYQSNQEKKFQISKLWFKFMNFWYNYTQIEVGIYTFFGFLHMWEYRKIEFLMLQH